MNDKAILTVDVRSYWHAGTGRGSGHHLDALVEVRDGIPYLPGKHLRGLLRDAVYRLERWGTDPFVIGKGDTERLFGPRVNGTDSSAREKLKPLSGMLAVSDASLPEDVRQWLQTDEGKKHLPHLFREHHSTAIDDQTGIAENRSLRGMQIAVPLVLEAEIERVKPVDGCDWKEKIRFALPLVRAVGGHRSRGFGRSLLSWQGGHHQGASHE